MEKKNLNNIVQEKLKKIEDTLIPGSKWDKSASWQKIRQLLDTKNKQMVIWYFAAAASLSFAFAATLNENLNVFKNSIDELLTKPIADAQPVLKENQNGETIAIEKTEPLNIKRKAPYQPPVQLVAPATPQLIQESIATIEIPKNNVSSSRISVEPALNFGSFTGRSVMSGLSGGVSLDLRYHLNKHHGRSGYMAVGVQSTLIPKHNTEDQFNIYPATFLTTKYGQTSVNKNGQNKVWEIGASYLLNPDQEIFEDSTIKIQYNRTIVGRLRGGPELIFTNKFRKVYPGFTIVFS